MAYDKGDGKRNKDSGRYTRSSERLNYSKEREAAPPTDAPQPPPNHEPPRQKASEQKARRPGPSPSESSKSSPKPPRPKRRAKVEVDNEGKIMAQSDVVRIRYNPKLRAIYIEPKPGAQIKGILTMVGVGIFGVMWVLYSRIQFSVLLWFAAFYGISYVFRTIKKYRKANENIITLNLNTHTLLRNGVPTYAFSEIGGLSYTSKTGKRYTANMHVRGQQEPLFTLRDQATTQAMVRFLARQMDVQVLS